MADEETLVSCTSCGRFLPEGQFVAEEPNVHHEYEQYDEYGDLIVEAASPAGRVCLECDKVDKEKAEAEAARKSEVNRLRRKRKKERDKLRAEGKLPPVELLEVGQMGKLFCNPCQAYLDVNLFSQRQRKGVKADKRKCHACAQRAHAEHTGFYDDLHDEAMSPQAEEDEHWNPAPQPQPGSGLGATPYGGGFDADPRVPKRMRTGGGYGDHAYARRAMPPPHGGVPPPYARGPVPPPRGAFRGNSHVAQNFPRRGFEPGPPPGGRGGFSRAPRGRGGRGCFPPSGPRPFNGPPPAARVGPAPIHANGPPRPLSSQGPPRSTGGANPSGQLPFNGPPPERRAGPATAAHPDRQSNFDAPPQAGRSMRGALSSGPRPVNGHDLPRSVGAHPNEPRPFNSEAPPANVGTHPNEPRQFSSQGPPANGGTHPNEPRPFNSQGPPTNTGTHPNAPRPFNSQGQPTNAGTHPHVRRHFNGEGPPTNTGTHPNAPRPFNSEGPSLLVGTHPDEPLPFNNRAPSRNMGVPLPHSSGQLPSTRDVNLASANPGGAQSFHTQRPPGNDDARTLHRSNPQPFVPRDQPASLVPGPGTHVQQLPSQPGAGTAPTQVALSRVSQQIHAQSSAFAQVVPAQVSQHLHQPLLSHSASPQPSAAPMLQASATPPLQSSPASVNSTVGTAPASAQRPSGIAAILQSLTSVADKLPPARTNSMQSHQALPTVFASTPPVAGGSVAQSQHAARNISSSSSQVAHRTAANATANSVGQPSGQQGSAIMALIQSLSAGPDKVSPLQGSATNTAASVPVVSSRSSISATRGSLSQAMGTVSAPSAVRSSPTIPAVPFSSTMPDTRPAALTHIQQSIPPTNILNVAAVPGASASQAAPVSSGSLSNAISQLLPGSAPPPNDPRGDRHRAPNDSSPRSARSAPAAAASSSSMHRDAHLVASSSSRRKRARNSESPVPSSKPHDPRLLSTSTSGRHKSESTSSAHAPPKKSRDPRLVASTVSDRRKSKKSSRAPRDPRFPGGDASPKSAPTMQATSKPRDPRLAMSTSTGHDSPKPRDPRLATPAAYEESPKPRDPRLVASSPIASAAEDATERNSHRRRASSSAKNSARRSSSSSSLDAQPHATAAYTIDLSASRHHSAMQ